jgi:hypothetical protein
VSDRGLGIDAGLLPKVFEPFTQGNPALDRTQGGLGIGLYLVKNLVDLHGGTVTAQSDGPGLGATFTVALPLMKHVPAGESIISAPRAAASVARQVLRGGRQRGWWGQRGGPAEHQRLPGEAGQGWTGGVAPRGR